MNTESSAIVALILILILGFLAFIFIGNGNKPATETSGETSQSEPIPEAIPMSETRTNEVIPEEMEVQSQPIKQDEEKTGFKNRSIDDLIVVTSPVPYQEITSPLIIEGKARGFWFFEADFPVMLSTLFNDIRH